MRNTESDPTRAAGRPRVICHMMISVDGRIVAEGWPLSREGRRQYEEVHSTYEPDAWLCGRVTMEQHFAGRTRSDGEVARTYDGPPRRFIAGADAIGTAEQKITALKEDIEYTRALSTSLDFDTVAVSRDESA